MSVIDDPAAAVAAGLCLASRAIREPTARHPGRCDWCGYPQDELGRMVSGFLDFAGRDPRSGAWRDFEAARFQALPAADQRAAVTAAQGLDAPGGPVGGVESSEGVPGIGPHGSRLPTDSGSKISAGHGTPEPMAAPGPAPSDAGEAVPWI